ncbi:hypothetical protein [Cryobacterium sp.]|jgi:hypothetical protein|uniref:DUF7882 family protein n=1 Tax=Cryobacterium sp. TaxID=1926290 RepID=UPI002606CD0C|nr:hypothetical protein [Cryobacterium sp.]MCU1445809.1 ATP-dependent ligase [Cryobacterium sp.]
MLIYGTETATLVVDDRTLWHLKIVILDKLRRGESHTFTWTTSHGDREGMDCVWLNSATPLHFIFDDSTEIPLNWLWIEALVRAANSPTGLQILPEVPAKPKPRSAHEEETGVL